jgi:hypothetical protein
MFQRVHLTSHYSFGYPTADTTPCAVKSTPGPGLDSELLQGYSPTRPYVAAVLILAVISNKYKNI